MKILHLMLGPGLGGIEQVFIDYTHMLRAEGMEVIPVIHPRAAIRSQLPDALFLPNWNKRDPIAKLRMRRLVARHRPDIILTHGNRALAFGKQNMQQVKLIAVAHNYWIKHFAGLTHAIGITEDIAQKLRDLGIPDVTVIPNVITTPEQLPARTSFRSPPVIGAMGRFVQKKGFDIFLHALAELKKRGIVFRAVLGGHGEEERNLHSLVKNNGLEESVQFVGWVKDKHAFFEQIDIFVLPSRSEPFGIVLLEAFVHGVPVISSCSEGASVIATHEKDAFLYEENGLADALEKLLGDETVARQLAANGFETARHYQPSIIGKQLKEILENIL